MAARLNRVEPAARDIQTPLLIALANGKIAEEVLGTILHRIALVHTLRSPVSQPPEPTNYTKHGDMSIA